MTTTSATSGSNPYSYLNGSGSATAAKAALNTAKEQSDRFLKLLTTQLQNQDPLNPMDNAQMTTQMAQISTVSGIETLNASIKSLQSQFMQTQMLQGASLVGRDVLTEGDRLAIDGGTGRGSFDLASAAGNVRVEIRNAAGGLVDTVPMGALGAGRHDFEWPSKGATDNAGYSFKVVATGAAGAPITSTALARDRVTAVATGGETLTLQLQRGGSVAYDAVRSVH